MLADVGLVQCTENTSAYKHQSDNVQESSHNILFNDLIHVESSHVQNLQIISQKTAVMRAKTSNRGGNEDFINIKNIPLMLDLIAQIIVLLLPSPVLHAQHKSLLVAEKSLYFELQAHLKLS